MVKSLKVEAGRVVLIDNGSSDGTDGTDADLGGTSVGRGDGVTTCGRGMNTTLSLIGSFANTDILIRSNDDILWRHGRASRLRHAWAAAPPEMILINGFLQPLYEWDKPICVLNVGGEAVVERTSPTGGALRCVARR